MIVNRVCQQRRMRGYCLSILIEMKVKYINLINLLVAILHLSICIG